MSSSKTARLKARRKSKVKKRILRAAGFLKHIVRRKQKIRLKSGK